jgi:hypothetical protein
VVERRNMINDYLRGSACIESVMRFLIQEGFWVWSFLAHSAFLALLCHLAWFAAFRAFCWLCGFSFFWMALFSFSWLFGLLAELHGVLDSNFKLCAFVVKVLIKGEIEKPSGQLLGLIVMSHWLAEV